MRIEDFLSKYRDVIKQDSELLFLTEFLFPLVGEDGLEYVVPQKSFIDSSGKLRRIDFAIQISEKRIALEVDGEGYHSEGFISSEQFDDNLFRQNEIVKQGWYLLRFSLNQLLDKKWRPIVRHALQEMLSKVTPELLGKPAISPNPLQKAALEALEFYRSHSGWQKAIVVLPTGTGKTYLSAFDAQQIGGHILFVVHRLDILKQSQDAYDTVWPKASKGILTGDAKENLEADVLFASKDTLYQDETLAMFYPTEFDYIIVDEVHHGQTPTYRKILSHFRPKFMLGMTATPDRLDRKDIFELFDYNKAYEATIYDAIEYGYVVPFTYFGLLDDINYNSIRYSGNRYNIQDLERALIIPKRNEAVLLQYLEKGQGDKAIGFCVSIEHAERMADFFITRGIPSAAIHSQSPDRDELIAKFRNDQFSVVFTVDLFNEGVDIPNIRVLMFLRPTESKTVFLQQLGRGLRLCPGKDRAIILDFIGNYKKANQVRKYLAKKEELTGGQTFVLGKRVPKVSYVYAPGCEVHFQAEVEEILARQDLEEEEVTSDDLRQAYFALAEELGHKPTQEDINSRGQFKISRYLQVFGSWVRFLRDVGEYTEASYHYPQGVHIGHILYILKVIGDDKRSGTLIDDQYLRIRGGLESGRVGHLQRQTKYKLQAMMELGLIPDDRELGAEEQYRLKLTAKGVKLFEALNDFYPAIDLSFRIEKDRGLSWSMIREPKYFNEVIREYALEKPEASRVIGENFLSMHAAQQMINYLYRVERKRLVGKNSIYSGFFDAPFVKEYCDQNGIESATEEGARHRCPFLINILEALGIVEQDNTSINTKVFVIADFTMRMERSEPQNIIDNRVNTVVKAWPTQENLLDPDELSKLREAFGATFLTDQFWIKDYMLLE